MTASIKCLYSEIWPIDQLVENPRNPKKHPPDQIELIGKVIIANGWRAPIVVSRRSGLVVKGHGRLAGARAAGLTEVPVEIQDYESDALEIADMIADNRMSELSERKEDKLTAILEDLKKVDVDIATAGFSALAFEELFERVRVAGAGNRRTPRVGGSVLQYNIIFDNALQQQEFFALLKALKARYPQQGSPAARVTEFFANALA